MRLIDADSLLLKLTNEEAISAVKSEPTVVCKTCTVNDALTKRIDELEGKILALQSSSKPYEEE